MRTILFVLTLLLLAGVTAPSWLSVEELGPRTCVEGRDQPQDCR